MTVTRILVHAFWFKKYWSFAPISCKGMEYGDVRKVNERGI